ncbi:hypothetical protein OCU04_006824 [Sclerotinia nivalis]|uniref:Uncharacterized protein n=1 Tax=Sclerotinia nivalis TaxID=352851 RepID=A0A9X0AKK9_9HELO|nr:hypothetical protein OCU04_006824 [Sclerotinia nivalis]
MNQLPADFFVSSTAFAKTTHIQQYDAVDPTSTRLSQAGKVVIITDANRGLGPDITDLTAVEEVYHKIKNTSGTADVLVKNAEVFTSQNSLANVTPKNWCKILYEINVKGTFFMTRGFLKLVGPGGPGTIINLAMSGSLRTYPNTSSYAMSKLSTVHLQSYVAAENPNIAAMSLDPCLAEENKKQNKATITVSMLKDKASSKQCFRRLGTRLQACIQSC